MNLQQIKLIGVSLLGAMLVSACGGSSGTAAPSTSGSTSSSSAPPLQSPTEAVSGVYDGNISSTSQPITAILQNDGSYYLVYSDSTNKPLGVVLGSGVSSSGNFTSANATDLNLVFDDKIQLFGQGSLSASLRDKQSFSGTVTYNASAKPPFSFAANYNAASASVPSLASIAGTYNGSITTAGLTEDAILLTITADGKLSGQLSCGCTVLTTLTPRSDGTGYEAGLVFQGGTHPFSNQSMAGNVFVDTVKKRLYIFGKMSGSGALAIYVGTKS
jgi:hypothetical protein